MKRGLLSFLLASVLLARAASPQAEHLSRPAITMVLANLDDDDRDGKPDCFDQKVNSPRDWEDLAPIIITIPSDLFGQNDLFLELNTEAMINVFHRKEDHLELVQHPLPVEGTAKEIFVEATKFADGAFSGRADLTATVLDSRNRVVHSHVYKLRVAPWIMLPNSAPATRLFVATGPYRNGQTVAELRAILAEARVAFPEPYLTADWREMWMQDTMEVGYTQLPGHKPMHVVLNGVRGADTFGPSLLGPDCAVIRVGAKRDLEGADGLADWFGNLEVTHPLPNYPFGRVYFGRNEKTGTSFHPEIISFIEAQRVQAPFSIDTSWLLVKHVDEIMNFLPGQDGGGWLIIASPREAVRLWGDTANDAYNQSIQEQLDALLRQVKTLTGIDEDRILPLPVCFQDGRSRWSNPVNCVHLNGQVLVGNTDLPEEIKTALTASFARAGTKVRWVNDRAYHHYFGNLHCACNAVRSPLVQDLKSALEQLHW